MDDNTAKQPGGKKNNRRHGRRPAPAAQNYTPPYAEDVLAKPLNEIGLGEQTLAVLTAGKLTTVGDVVRRRKQEMFRVQNFGKKQLVDLGRALTALGVDFRPEETKPQQPEGDKKPAREPRAEAKGGREEQKGGQGQRRREEKGQKQPPQEADRERRAKGGNAEDPLQGGQAQQGGRREKGKGKGRHDDGMTLDKLFPRPKLVRLPRIEAPTDDFVKFQRGGKWGFKNKQGVEVIPPIYDEVFAFKEDFACVERKQLFGFINRQNELVIPYRYVCASSFSEGYACVSDENLCGYINKQGEVVVPFKYEAGTAVHNGLAHVKLDGKWGILTIATNEISWA